ncbi:thioesterase II family protein [Streptomyces sp. NPDC101191]|uniref:thioesterase II family protein n=1 Tax=Streptomyces sp. NPDC101191 TaxID=3366126 RepID=UPI00381B0700
MRELPGGWYDLTPAAPGTPAGPYALLFPFAGGNIHSMREWIAELGPGWRPLVAQYPLRGRRQRTPMPASLTELATELGDAFMEFAPGERPLLLGHSLGAHLAHAAAVRLEERGVAPRLLVAAASRTADGTARPGEVPLHRRSDPDLIEALGLDGTVPEALADPRFAELFLPVIRADLRLGHDHLAAGYARTVHCPVLAVGGTEDPLAGPDDVSAWSRTAAGDFALELVPGGHFFQQAGGTGLRGHFDRALTDTRRRHPVPAAPYPHDDSGDAR